MQKLEAKDEGVLPASKANVVPSFCNGPLALRYPRLFAAGLASAATTVSWNYFTKDTALFNLNYKEAFRWSKAGAEGGHTNAYSNLALHYFTGYGVEQNFRKMVEHLILSAELFTEEFRWVTEGPDEWLDYKDLAPKEFMDARGLWWQAITTGNKKYIKRLKALI